MNASSLILVKFIDEQSQVRVVFSSRSFKGSLEGVMEWLDDSKSEVLIRPNPNPLRAELTINIAGAEYHYGDRREAPSGMDASRYPSILTVLLASGDFVYIAEIEE